MKVTKHRISPYFFKVSIDGVVTHTVRIIGHQFITKRYYKEILGHYEYSESSEILVGKFNSLEEAMLKCANDLSSGNYEKDRANVTVRWLLEE